MIGINEDGYFMQFNRTDPHPPGPYLQNEIIVHCVVQLYGSRWNVYFIVVKTVKSE